MKEIYVRTKLVNGTYVYAPKGTADTYGTVLIDNDTLRYNGNKLEVNVSVLNGKLNEDTLNKLQALENKVNNITNAYVIVTISLLPDRDTEYYKYKKPDGTIFNSGDEIRNYVENGSNVGSFFSSPNDRIVISYKETSPDNYIICEENGYYIIYKISELLKNIKIGDSFYLEEQAYPDRWVSGFSENLDKTVGSISLIAYESKKQVTNLIDGTGVGSLKQLTKSSSGVPYQNEASGNGAVAFGKDTKSKGNSSFVVGQKNTATENASRGFVGGYDNTIDNATTFVFGQGLKNSRERKASFGQWNKDEYETLFEVGCGTSDEDRRNAFEVRNNGLVIMKDRAKVYGAPQDPTDVIRKQDLEKSQDDFNLKNGTGTKSVEQIINNGTTTTIPISTKNPNAVSLGAPTSVNVGAVGESTSSFGGASNATGKRSHSEGTNTVAIGKYSHAEGDNSVALGNDSHAEGITTVAKGRASHSEGSTTQSIGDHSHAEGSETISRGYSSHSEGGNTQASGNTSHAEGSNTIASGDASHAEGSSTQATIDQAHAEGLETKASGTASHSEGVSSTSEGAYSHAEGYKSTTKKTAYTPPSGTESGSGMTGDAGDTGSSWNIEQHRGEGAHSEGILTQSSGYSSHSEGVRTVADGHYSHSEGQLTYAKGSSSHAEGLQTNAEGKSSHAEGSITKAIGHSSHAEGYETTASGDYSHAEGYSTQASHYSHSEGNSTVASGFYSHSEGSETEAKHEASHAEGAYTRTSRATQHVGGKYNADNSNALLIIGNGDSDSNRKNAFEVLADGRAKVQSAPVDNDDVVRKGDLSGVGGGTKLYKHSLQLVALSGTNNPNLSNIVFYSTRQSKYSISELSSYIVDCTAVCDTSDNKSYIAKINTASWISSENFMEVYYISSESTVLQSGIYSSTNLYLVTEL